MRFSTSCNKVILFSFAASLFARSKRHSSDENEKYQGVLLARGVPVKSV